MAEQEARMGNATGTKHNNSVGGTDARGPALSTTGIAPGKRTLTDGLEASEATSATGPQLKGAPGSVQRKIYSSLALSAFSPVADSFAASGGGVASQVGGDLPVQHKTAADVADGGFKGSGQEIPHRAAMEQSFGMDFGHVRAHTDAGASRANDTLGSHAYAMGDQVAFKSASPAPALVAHELTHVVQHSQNPQGKTDGSVDTAGEAEAEAVEAAVSSGRPAHSALRSGPGGGGGPGLKSIAGSPAFKKRGPALEGGEGGSKFGMGMTFSLEGFEKSYDYTIWKGHYPWPTPVPGVNFVVDPSVKVSGKGAAKYGGESKGDLSAQLGVFGECGVGLSGGIPDVAEIYGTFNPAIEGAFTLTKHGNAGAEGAKHDEHKPEGEHKEGAEAKGPASTWSLVGAIGLKAAVKIGVSLGGGIVDQAFELGSIEICKLTGVYFDQTGFRKDKIGFEWSEKIKQTFETIKVLVEKAKRLGRAGIEAAKKAGRFVSGAVNAAGHAIGDAGRAVGNAASTVGNAAVNAAGAFGHWVMSW
jgi:Domain of unknown function (DUF4157)